MTPEELATEKQAIRTEHEALQAEHRELEIMRHDIAGHEAHRVKLQAHIERLHRFVAELQTLTHRL